MSGNLTSTSYQMATNDFVSDLKSLSLSQTTDEYSNTIERLLIQLKQATPNGLIEDKPLALSIVDNLYRVIPIFDKKLSEENENSYQTNLFLETLASTFQGLCLIHLFYAIKDSSRLENIFHNYIPLLKENYFMNNNNNHINYDNLIICLLPIISYSNLRVSINEDNLPPNLLIYLLEFTKLNWQYEQKTTVILSILALLKTFSKNPLLVPMIIRSEWPNACIQWLTTIGSRPSFKIDFLICLILQKLARHTIGVETLNRLNCINALAQSKESMKKYHNEEEYLCIEFIQSITHALLVEADELKRNSTLADQFMGHVLEQLMSYIEQASKNDSFIYRGCHIADVLLVLSKLFVNDDILTKCLNQCHQTFNDLCDLLIQFSIMTSDITIGVSQPQNDEVLIILANLLWSISFHQIYHEKFKTNKKLMNTLSNLATSSSLYTGTQINSIPRDLCSLKKAADGILWNLKSLHLNISKDKSEHQHIMISYCHSDAKFCRELVEHLSHHIPVWVDYKQTHGPVHSDDIWEGIAGAMETATVIVLIISKEYYDSKSCRQELSYASDTLKKRIVPIYAPNQQYKANGWLGIRIAGQKYVHFGRKIFTDAVNELLSMVVTDQQLITTPQSSLNTVPIKTNEQENALKNWTSKDIRKWFDENHIHNDLITLFVDQFHTGTALIVYAHHLKQFYRNEYVQILTNYYKAFNGKRLRTIDFITFVDAFWRLREQYDPQSKVEDAWEKYASNQLLCTTRITNEGMTWL